MSRDRTACAGSLFFPLAAALLLSSCSVGRLVYTADDPERLGDAIEALESFGEDARVEVELTDGSRFHARYRGTSVSSPCFDRLEWKSIAPGRDTTAPEKVWMFSAEEIRTLSRSAASTGEWVTGGLGLAFLIYMLASFQPDEG